MTLRTEAPRRDLSGISAGQVFWNLSPAVLYEEAIRRQPRRTWSDPAACDRQAQQLAEMFRDTFRTFEPMVAPDVRAAGPNV